MRQQAASRITHATAAVLAERQPRAASLGDKPPSDKQHAVNGMKLPKYAEEVVHESE
jgi:hypothetical protein